MVTFSITSLSVMVFALACYCYILQRQVVLMQSTIEHILQITALLSKRIDNTKRYNP